VGSLAELSAAQLLLLYVCALSAAAFLMMAADKRRAEKQRRRISERALITAAFLGGGPGALLGMLICRHKIQKTKFRVCLPLAAALWPGLILLAGRFLG